MSYIPLEAEKKENKNKNIGIHAAENN